MDPSGLCSEYMGQLSDDDDEGLGDFAVQRPLSVRPGEWRGDYQSS